MAASPTHESNPFAQSVDSPAHYDAQKDDFGVQDLTAPVAFHVNNGLVKEARYEISFRDISMVFFASGFLLAETARQCDVGSCGSNMVWGIICSCVGLVISGFYCVMMGFGPSKHDRDTKAKATPLVASVLCLLYTAGTGVLTFDGPYTEAGNGYFFAWAAFLSALHAVYLSIEPIHALLDGAWESMEFLEKQCIAVCLLASCVEVTASSVDCGWHDECSDKIYFGIAVGAFSVVYCVITATCYASITAQLPWLAAFLTLLWGITAVVLTFAGGPYSTLGNAYFGTWGAFSSAAGLTVLRMADSGRGTHTRIPDCPEEEGMAQMDTSATSLPKLTPVAAAKGEE